MFSVSGDEESCCLSFFLPCCCLRDEEVPAALLLIHHSVPSQSSIFQAHFSFQHHGSFKVTVIAAFF